MLLYTEEVRKKCHFISYQNAQNNGVLIKHWSKHVRLITNDNSVCGVN